MPGRGFEPENGDIHQFLPPAWFVIPAHFHAAFLASTKTRRDGIDV
jgi:hypothetical protein